MKIQPLKEENQPKAYALLRSAFPGRSTEADLVATFHANNRAIHEWVCIHRSKIVGYIAFSNAYHGSELCGLHLGPMAVSLEMQKQGVGSELLRFALRQPAIKEQPLFVLGPPSYYQKFGFTPCQGAVCPFAHSNGKYKFLSLGHAACDEFTVGYEPEFTMVAMTSAKPNGKANAGGNKSSKGRGKRQF